MGKDFLFVAHGALSLDLAHRLLKEGHKVKMFIRDEESKEVGHGIVERVNEWESHVGNADVVVFDDIGLGKEQDKLRKKGILVVGGSEFGDRLENERSFGQAVLQKVGVKTLHNKNFKSFEDAIEFVKQHPNRYVIKPSGEAEEYKEFTYVGRYEDGKDVIAMLDHFKAKWVSQAKVDFQLQEFVKGVEVAVAAYFNGEDFIKPININFENKKLFDGNIGPNTWEMGTFMFWSQTGGKLFRETLLKMRDLLRKDRYVGDIDINCIVNSSGAHPLEFTCRFGYPEIGIELENYKVDMGEFLYNLADGTAKKLDVKKKWACGVVVAVPPWPYWNAEEFETQSKNIPVLGEQTRFHMGQLKMLHGRRVLAAPSGYLGVCAGIGNTLQIAQKEAYAAVKQIHAPNMMYRTDIGDRWKIDGPRLKKWGYL